MDSRAWRLALPPDVAWFEVDQVRGGSLSLFVHHQGQQQ